MLSRALAHFSLRHSWRAFASAARLVPAMEASSSEVAAILSRDIELYEDFITPQEEQSILDEVEPHLAQLHYEFDHWDNAIHGFRETERRVWSPQNAILLQRIRNFAFPPDVKQLEYVHVLDLASDGHIKPHVDSTRFCGNVIAGLSLLSDCVMRFEKEINTQHWAKLLLPQRSLYVTKGVARYDFTHAILKDKESYVFGNHVRRDRRISVMCRNEA